MRKTNAATACSGWTVDLVKLLLNEGSMLCAFNDAYLMVIRSRPSQVSSEDPLNRFLQEGNLEFTSPILVPFAIGQQAAAELGAVRDGDSHQMNGRSFKVLARFHGEHIVNQAHSYMYSHPGTTVLDVLVGQVIIARAEDKGTPFEKAAQTPTATRQGKVMS